MFSASERREIICLEIHFMIFRLEDNRSSENNGLGLHEPIIDTILLDFGSRANTFNNELRYRSPKWLASILKTGTRIDSVS